MLTPASPISRRMLCRAGILTLACLAFAPAAALARPSDDVRDLAKADLESALDELDKKCGHFFKTKGVDWKKVRKEMKKLAGKVETESEHYELLVTLLARLRDGHCAVKPGKDWPEGTALPYPESWKEQKVGAGLMFCKTGKKIYVRNSWSTAAAAGIKPGMEVLSVDGVKAAKWLDQLIEETSERSSFSTDHHARYGTWRWGFSKPPGTRVKFELKADKKSKRRTLTFDKAKTYMDGPAVTPEGTVWMGRSVRWGKSPAGNGYLHFRRIDDDILSELDRALTEMGPVPGMVVDFRSNSGGGVDHDALEARFVPAGGKKLERASRSALASAGSSPYGGPMVVIVDGSVVSAGETTSGMFKEDGRAYMIGESPTAGMSASKETLQLPSGKFALYISVRSNRSDFNGGKGIEGIGVEPHELVEYDPKELTEGIDSMIRHADELLADFPQKEVSYDPKDFGWEKPEKK
ncbi:MAG: carboxyl-terminal processing protease [Planctomycetota bacterium]|jgi:carboxyl-terminal processing protease